MFDRRMYKAVALSQLSGYWKIPVLLTLIIILTSSFAFIFLSDSLTILKLCVSAVFCLSASKFCIEFARNRAAASFDSFFEGMSYAGKAIRAYFWYLFWALLWALLFVIPGMVKMVSYSMMYFILAENPDVGVCRAMRISKIVTAGHKGDLFVMWLSFAGWHILSCITFGIGFLWLLPYMQLSYVHAYQYLKLEALTKGLLAESDFRGCHG